MAWKTSCLFAWGQQKSESQSWECKTTRPKQQARSHCKVTLWCFSSSLPLIWRLHFLMWLHSRAGRIMHSWTNIFHLWLRLPIWDLSILSKGSRLSSIMAPSACNPRAASREMLRPLWTHKWHGVNTEEHDTAGEICWKRAISEAAIGHSCCLDSRIVMCTC